MDGLKEPIPSAAEFLAESTWETVTLKPPIKTRRGENYQQMMSACGRVLLVVGPDSAQVYRRAGERANRHGHVRVLL